MEKSEIIGNITQNKNESPNIDTIKGANIEDSNILERKQGIKKESQDDQINQ